MQHALTQLVFKHQRGGNLGAANWCFNRVRKLSETLQSWKSLTCQQTNVTNVQLSLYICLFLTCAVADCRRKDWAWVILKQFFGPSERLTSSSVLSIRLLFWSAASFSMLISIFCTMSVLIYSFALSFLHVVIVSSFPPCCALLSFGFLIMLSAAVACHHSFEVCLHSF